MLDGLKRAMRKRLSGRLEVPAKYWLHAIKGDVEPEMKLLPMLVQRGDHVLDIGGNRGTYAYRLRQLGARIEVFEPNPVCLRVLGDWAAGRSDVTLHAVALSSHAGHADLRIPVDNAGTEHDASASLEVKGTAHAAGVRTEAVALRPLDSFGFRDATLIKIDVEGHEYSVIEGAGETIAASTPALLIEIEQRHSTRPIREVFGKVLDFGYRGFFLLDGVLTPIEQFDLAVHQDWSGSRSARYHNNFLFLGEQRLARGEYRRLTEGRRG